MMRALLVVLLCCLLAVLLTLLAVWAVRAAASGRPPRVEDEPPAARGGSEPRGRSDSGSSDSGSEPRGGSERHVNHTGSGAHAPFHHALTHVPPEDVVRGIAEARARAWGKTGGGPRGAPRRPWREYAHWHDLARDPGAMDEYFRESEQINLLTTDWSGVREALKDKVGRKADREWFGRIDVVGGKARVVELLPSPDAIGEGVDKDIYVAQVPSEAFDKVVSRPCHIVFHTHPGSEPGDMVPSAPDLYSAASFYSYYPHVAEAVVSEDAIALYGISSEGGRRINDAPNPYYEGVRTAFDVFNTLTGTRSRLEPLHTLGSRRELLRTFGMFFDFIPANNFAQEYFGFDYAFPETADTALTRDVLGMLNKLRKLKGPITSARRW